jgi:hypothetical protein
VDQFNKKTMTIKTMVKETTITASLIATTTILMR